MIMFPGYYAFKVENYCDISGTVSFSVFDHPWINLLRSQQLSLCRVAAVRLPYFFLSFGLSGSYTLSESSELLNFGVLNVQLEEPVC